MFDGTPVSFFVVPHSLIGDKTRSPMCLMSAPALRLYLLLLAKVGREPSSKVVFDNEYFQDRAKVGKNAIVKVRQELIDRRLIRVTPQDDLFEYEILDPSTGESLPRASAQEKVEVLTADDVDKICRWFGVMALEDNEKGGLQYICPCHDGHDVSHDGDPLSKKRKGKHSYLHINPMPNSRYGWLYNCSFPGCYLRGKGRLETIRDSYDEPVDEVIDGGGGNLINLVGSLQKRIEKQSVNRQAAEDILLEILKHPPKPMPMPMAMGMLGDGEEEGTIKI